MLIPNPQVIKTTSKQIKFLHFRFERNSEFQEIPIMKRALNSDEEDPIVENIDDERMKKKKSDDDDEEDEETEGEGGGIVHHLGDDLLFEVLKHFDARSLGVASCVNKRWYKISQDERLWEMICTRHWANIGCGTQQLRSVVLALGGFRNLHSLYIWPLLKLPSSSSSSSSSSTSIRSLLSSRNTKTPTTPNWGKDEVHLSLSLLSIRYYEMMNHTKRR